MPCRLIDKRFSFSLRRKEGDWPVCRSLELALASPPLHLSPLDLISPLNLISTRLGAPQPRRLAPQDCLTRQCQDPQDPNHLQDQLPRLLLHGHQGTTWPPPKVHNQHQETSLAFGYFWLPPTSGVKQAGPVDWGLTTCPGPHGPWRFFCVSQKILFWVGIWVLVTCGWQVKSAGQRV